MFSINQPKKCLKSITESYIQPKLAVSINHNFDCNGPLLHTIVLIIEFYLTLSFHAWCIIAIVPN